MTMRTSNIPYLENHAALLYFAQVEGHRWNNIFAPLAITDYIDKRCLNKEKRRRVSRWEC